MKKLILTLSIILPLFCYSQQGGNVLYSKFVNNDTITADTGYEIKTSADYTWMLFATWESLADSSSTIALQVSGNNGANYAGVTGMATINMNTTTGCTGYQGDYSPGNKYRIYVNVGATDTVVMNIWYTFKLKTR